MSNNIQAFFSTDYFSCRKLFLSTARRLQLPHQSFVNPVPGPQGQELTTDTVLLGDATASNLAIIVSGTHGLESFAGSGIQIGLLNRLQQSSLVDISVLLVHTLNPWGSAFLRRQNEDNVDLNRNFFDSMSPFIENSYYDLLHPIIHVDNVFIDGQFNVLVEEQINFYIKTHGEMAFQTALFQGQSKHPDGVGFCGLQPTWSNQTIQQICKQFSHNKKQVALIDLHTGLGSFGKGIFFCPQDLKKSNSEHARNWFGDKLQGDASLPYKPSGNMLSALPNFFPNNITAIGMGLEFGTYEIERLLATQINDSWLYNFGDAKTVNQKQIKQDLVDFFYPNNAQWREGIFNQSEAILQRLIRAMSN